MRKMSLLSEWKKQDGIWESVKVVGRTFRDTEVKTNACLITPCFIWLSERVGWWLGVGLVAISFLRTLITISNVLNDLFYEDVDHFWGRKLNLSRSSTLKLLCMCSWWGVGVNGGLLLIRLPVSYTFTIFHLLMKVFLYVSADERQSESTSHCLVKWGIFEFLNQNPFTIRN